MGHWRRSSVSFAFGEKMMTITQTTNITMYWGLGPIPIGSTVLGIVDRGHMDIGVLLLMPTGILVQGNAGSIRSLPQSQVKAAINHTYFKKTNLKKNQETVAEENAQKIFLELQSEQEELRKQFPQIRPTMQDVIDAKKRVKKNPETKAIKKALAWYQKKSLVNGSQVIKLPDTVEAVEIGRIVSITYESDKYDGKKKRLWKHDVTGQKILHISTDGKVMVILPGFKVTKRGIEG